MAMFILAQLSDSMDALLAVRPSMFADITISASIEL